MVCVRSLVDVSDELATMAARFDKLDEVLDGGYGGPDAGVVGDVLVLVERHVEVGTHEDALALEVGLREVLDALLGHGGHGPRAACGGRLPAPRRDVDREPRIARHERQRPRRLAPRRKASPAQRGGGGCPGRHVLCSAVFMVEANGRRMRMNGWQWQWC